jgi:hypothetical protein
MGGLISQTLELQAQVMSLNSFQMSGEWENRVCVDQYVSAVRVVKVSVLACLLRICNHVTEVGGP